MADHRIILNLSNLAEAQNGHFALINLIQGTSGLSSRAFALDRFSSFLGANGVPSTSPPDDSIQTPLNVPASYSGQWLLKWTGTEALEIVVDVPITSVSDPGGVVVSSSGGVLKVQGTNGRVAFNTPGTNGGWQLRFPAGTYSSPGVPALMIAANEAAYDAGELFNPDYISALKSLNPKAIRMVKWGDPTLYSQPLTLGRPQNYLNYGGAFFPPSLYAGDLASSDGTTFTCSAAPATPGSITEGEMIYGWATSANTGATTLNVAGRGAKPVWSQDTSTTTGGEIPIKSVVAFVYDVVMDVYWLLTNVGNGFSTAGAPLSVMVALCNEVGCGMHYCFPVMTKLSEFRVVADYLRDNLVGTSRVEFANEVWGGAPPFPSGALQHWGTALFPADPGYGNPQALRSRQMHGAFTDSWNAAGRSLSSLKRVIANFDGGDPTQFLTAMEGGALSSYGFSSAPNRPIDFMDVQAYNTYIEGPNAPAFDNTTSYVATGQEGLYTAADNYASGDPARMVSALDFIDNDIRQGTGGNIVSIAATLGFKKSNPWPAWESAVAAYDASRIGAGQLPIEVVAYEGGVEILAPSVGTLNSLGLNGSLYGGGTGRINLLFVAFKNDPRFKQLCLDLFGDFVGVTQVHSTTPAWFDFVGDIGQWSLYPGDLYSTPFQSFNAIVAFDAAKSVAPLRFRFHA